MRNIILLPLIFLSGCMVGPNYVPPDPEIPEMWQFSENVSYEEPVTEWWKLFGDCLLDKYIELAYNHNNDLFIAEANILQARAMVQVARSKLFPQIIGDFNVSRTYFSKNGPVFAGPSFASGTNPVTGLPFQIQVPQIQNLYNALIDVSWEIDFFGKNRRGVEAACANLGVYIERKNSVLLSILADAAIYYIQIRGNQKLGSLIEQNISLLERDLEIIKRQLETGYRGCLDVERIEAELLNAKAILPDVYAQIIQNIYALSILTGELPETFMCELLPMQPLPKFPGHIAMGVRSDLLRRRPDVREAERSLALATANIGVAVASFFPTITLSGDIGFQSLSLSNLFQSQSKTWSFGGDVNMPLFTGGKLIGNLRISEAAAMAAAYNYQQVVLNAIGEAEANLIGYIQELKTAKIYEEAALKYREIVSVIDKRYKGGLSNLIDYLDTERQLIAAEENWVNSEIAALIDLIVLYKALGGGWECIN